MNTLNVVNFYLNQFYYLVLSIFSSFHLRKIKFIQIGSLPSFRFVPVLPDPRSFQFHVSSHRYVLRLAQNELDYFIQWKCHYGPFFFVFKVQRRSLHVVHSSLHNFLNIHGQTYTCTRVYKKRAITWSISSRWNDIKLKFTRRFWHYCQVRDWWDIFYRSIKTLRSLRNSKWLIRNSFHYTYFLNFWY